MLPELLAEPASAALAARLAIAVDGADLEYTAEDLPALLTDSTAAALRVAELVHSSTARAFARVPPGLGLSAELTELFVYVLITAAQAVKARPETVT